MSYSWWSMQTDALGPRSDRGWVLLDGVVGIRLGIAVGAGIGTRVRIDPEGVRALVEAIQDELAVRAWWRVGGARAGRAAGTRAVRPRCSRIRVETWPSSMNAITRMRPRQLAQRNTSSWKTRRSSDAQSSRRSRRNDGVQNRSTSKTPLQDADLRAEGERKKSRYTPGGHEAPNSAQGRRDAGRARSRRHVWA